jgi:PAS domain S-box-containing protein
MAWNLPMNVRMGKKILGSRPLSIGKRTAVIVLTALYALIGGIVTLIGWFTNLPRLTDWGGHDISMFVNTAICAIMSGGVLLGKLYPGRHANLVSRVLGALVFLLGGLTLFEHVTGIDLRIDTLLSDGPWGQSSAAAPMRMGPPASVAFSLFGLASILVTLRKRSARGLASILAMAVVAISLLSLIGYQYRAKSLYTMPHLTGIAEQTASILFALGVGLLAAIPNQGITRLLRRKNAGGSLTRTFLLPIIIVPVIAGGLLLWGQNAGLYDHSFGMALYSLTTIFFMFALMTWTGNRLSRADTVRRLQEISVRQSRGQLAGVLESLSDPFATLDAHWKFTSINDPGLARLELTREQIIGKNVWEVIPIAKGTEAYRQLHRAMRDRVAVRYEVHYEKLKRWFSESAAPITGGGLAVYSVEITDRKGAEQRLLRNEQTQRLLAEIGMLAATTGVRGGISQGELFETICQRIVAIMQVSRCAMSRVDLENQEIVIEYDAPGELPSLKGTRHALSQNSFLTEEGIAGNPTAIVDLAAEPRVFPHYEDVYQPLAIRALLTVPLHRNGKWVASFWVGQDQPRHWSAEEINQIKGIAERLWLAAEQTRIASALLESEERYRSLVSILTDVPWVTDAEGKFISPQMNWEAYTGQTWHEHADFGWLNGIHPDDRGLILQTWLDAVHLKKIYEARGRLWHAASGGWRHFVARAVPISNEDGTIREWVGTCTDISKQHRAEEALREADRRKDEFLAILAHELRNPLAPIRHAIEISRMSVPGDPNFHWAQDVIDRQVRHMARLIDDLLDVNRISRNRLELRTEVVDLKESIDIAIEATRPFVDENSHHLEIVLPAEPIYLVADVARLAQVISNLLNNACKYTEKAGHIRLIVEPNEGEVVIRVIDNGIGISPDVLPRIFDLFSQEESAMIRSRGGLGIGLSLVKRLVEMHGGQVEAISHGPQTGSEFRVRLPTVATPPAKRETKVTPTTQEKKAGLQILVVDDNRDAAFSLAELLRIMGHDAHMLTDGLEAIRLAGEYRPDVAILDIGLPGTSGYEVAKFIRSQTWGERMLLIALTGWGQCDDKKRSEEAGFDHHLVKPADADHLLKLLVEKRSN